MSICRPVSSQTLLLSAGEKYGFTKTSFVYVARTSHLQTHACAVTVNTLWSRGKYVLAQTVARRQRSTNHRRKKGWRSLSCRLQVSDRSVLLYQRTSARWLIVYSFGCNEAEKYQITVMPHWLPAQQGCGTMVDRRRHATFCGPTWRKNEWIHEEKNEYRWEEIKKIVCLN